MRGWVLLYLLAACSFEHGTPSADIDAAVVLPDSAEGCTSFSSQVDTCMLAPSDQDITLTGANTYDTTMGKLMAGSNPVAITRMQVAGKAGLIELMIVRDFRLMANAKLRATGDVPLAILAFGKIAIDGSAQVDISQGGAGARATCDSGALAGMPSTGGGAGGGGGGFAAVGGTGGNGDKDGMMTTGGAGGASATSIPLGPLGGCPGARGGDGDDSGGAGGAAGGAIYLVAKQRIDLAPGSGITAGGAGGKGGAAGFLSNGDAGGGGGGSGGMIMLEAPIVRGDGVLAANGGGGGEASGGGGGGNGGANGALGVGAANGGSGGSSTGTDGGAGGAKAAPAGVAVTAFDNGGGGGGGGSVGYIIIKSSDAVISLVSPNPS
jgi:hypothetical protein